MSSKDDMRKLVLTVFHPDWGDARVGDEPAKAIAEYFEALKEWDRAMRRIQSSNDWISFPEIYHATNGWMVSERAEW